MTPRARFLKLHELLYLLRWRRQDLAPESVTGALLHHVVYLALAQSKRHRKLVEVTRSAISHYKRFPLSHEQLTYDALLRAIYAET